jgi:hypothetical protein
MDDDPRITFELPAEVFQEGERERFQRALQNACDFRQTNPDASDTDLNSAALTELATEGFGPEWLPRLNKNAEIAFSRLRAVKAHQAGNA